MNPKWKLGVLFLLLTRETMMALQRAGYMINYRILSHSANFTRASINETPAPS